MLRYAAVKSFTSSLAMSTRTVSMLALLFRSISSGALLGAATCTGSGMLSVATGSRGRLGTLPYLTAGGETLIKPLSPGPGRSRDLGRCTSHARRSQPAARAAVHSNPVDNWKIGATISSLTPVPTRVDCNFLFYINCNFPEPIRNRCGNENWMRPDSLWSSLNFFFMYLNSRDVAKFLQIDFPLPKYSEHKTSNEIITY